jgi:hypothetical protein
MAPPQRSSQRLFAIFNALWPGGWPARSVRRINFDVDGEPWSFDPLRPGEPFARGSCQDAALTLTCSVALLAGVLSPTAYEPDDEGLSATGDLSALTSLADSLRGGATLLELRAGGDKT